MLLNSEELVSLVHLLGQKCEAKSSIASAANTKAAFASVVGHSLVFKTNAAHHNCSTTVSSKP